MRGKARRSEEPGIAKAATGIVGIDQITGGGLPRGRPTLVCGTAGSGKTLLAMEFLVRGAAELDEPGVFVAFEESAGELVENVRSLGFDVEGLVRRRKLIVDHVRVERNEIEETGEYNLDGLFIRIGHAIDAVKAKRVVLDTIESLFASFANEAILRAELRRLFNWLKEKGVTAVITGERGSGALTRRGLEEYVSDCVILLDNRVLNQVSTRRLRIVKYRGTLHGTNEYPFLIDSTGFSVLPITSLGLQHGASEQRISSGVAGIDDMLGGKGYFRGSSVLVTGTAGSGKTSLAAQFVDAACARGERCLYFAYEESQPQIVRNMRSIGVDLQRWIDKGLLHIHAARPASHGLEMHLVAIHKLVAELPPRAIVVDPITSLIAAGTQSDATAMLVRLMDFFKASAITSLMTSLTGGDDALEQTQVGVSSLTDTWLLLRDHELNGERNRTLFVLKSRGMNHSNQVREYTITRSGIQLRPAYLGPHGVLTGSARLAQEARDREDAVVRSREAERAQHELAARRLALQAQIASLETQLAQVSTEIATSAGREAKRVERAARDEREMRRSRRVSAPHSNGVGNG